MSPEDVPEFHADGQSPFDREVTMYVRNRKQAFTSPEAVFPHPGAVVQSSGLTDDEKVVVLRNWRKGLIRLRKSAAGTPLHDRPGDVGPQLEDVEAAILELNRHRPT